MIEQDQSKDHEALLLKVRHPGYTPGIRDLDRLCHLLSTTEEKDSELIIRALLRGGQASLAFVLRHLPLSVRPARARFTALAGKLLERHPDQSLRALIFSLLDDSDLKTRLNAINALGRLPGSDSEAALLGQLRAKGQREEIKKAAIRSLAKVGRESAKVEIESLVAKNSSANDVRELVGKAQLIIQRELSRLEGGCILDEVNLPKDTTVWLWCRRGLEELVIAEAREHGWQDAVQVADGIIAITHSGSLRQLWALRLILNFSLPVVTKANSIQAVAAALSSGEVATLLGSLTEGPVRYRLQMPKLTNAGIWRAVQFLADTVPSFVNDPRSSLWEFGQTKVGGKWHLDLCPKYLEDPRFNYRLADVPAASHPSIAAALARVAEVRPDDIIWDPFVGSGTELIECWRHGSASALYGTDLDERAIQAARSNAEAAGCASFVQTFKTDCLFFAPPRPTLIISNPPMGRRVHRGTLQQLFQCLLPKLATELASGGRLVWLSPLPQLTRQVLSEHNLRLVYSKPVDLGGFDAELQRWEKS